MIRNNYYSLYYKHLIIACALFCLLLLVNLYVSFEPSSLELALARWLQFGRPEWLTEVMKLISDSYLAIGIICGGVCLWCLTTKRYASAAILTLSLSCLLVIDPLKYLFQRPRPIVESPIVEYIAGTSFPSGHAYTATVLAGTLCFVYLFGYSGKHWRMSLVLAAAYTLLMAWSRVYLQVHYPSDVIGGIAFGALTVALLGVIYHLLGKFRFTRQPSLFD